MSEFYSLIDGLQTESLLTKSFNGLTMFGYRYFRANPEGTSHNALSAMETAGTKILENFQKIDTFSHELELVQVTLNGEIKAFSCIPNSGVGKFSRRKLRQQITDQLIAIFTRYSEELSKPDLFSIPIPALYVREGNRKLPIMEHAQALAPEITGIIANTKTLGLNPNIALKISEAIPTTNKFSNANPERAVLKISPYSFYLEARIAFSTWFIRLPPYIPLFHNDYAPPDCSRIDPKSLLEILDPMTFGEARCNHHIARNRILGLHRIELRSHLR